MPHSHREAVAHLEDYERTPTGVATRDNGAVVNGTYFDKYPEWASRDAVPVPLKAGSCTFHNGLTLHGAGVNMTPRRRRAMTCAYVSLYRFLDLSALSAPLTSKVSLLQMPDGSLFNGGQNVLPDSYFQTLTMGQPLDNNELNPLVYSQPRM